MSVTKTAPVNKDRGKRPTDMRALQAMIDEITKDVPPEAWEELPVDLAENFEEYAYGELAPKP